MEPVGHLGIIDHAGIVETPVRAIGEFDVRNQIIRTRIRTHSHLDQLRAHTFYRASRQQKNIQHVTAVKRNLRYLEPEIIRLMIQIEIHLRVSVMEPVAVHTEKTSRLVPPDVVQHGNRLRQPTPHETYLHRNPILFRKSGKFIDFRRGKRNRLLHKNRFSHRNHPPQGIRMGKRRKTDEICIDPLKIRKFIRTPADCSPVFCSQCGGRLPIPVICRMNLVKPIAAQRIKQGFRPVPGSVKPQSDHCPSSPVCRNSISQIPSGSPIEKPLRCVSSSTDELRHALRVSAAP